MRMIVTIGLLIASVSFISANAFARASVKARQEPNGKGRFVYLFTSFRGNGEDGLHLAYSEDGFMWTDLGGGFLAPKVGISKLMRDPAMILTPDGTFHMVWTAGWAEAGIGYASSRDLVNWTEQQYIRVMENDPTARNAWAPEVVFDEKAKQFVIYWSSTVPGKYPLIGDNAEEWNHRAYYVTTRDFKKFSATKLLFDPGFNCIDETLVKRDRGGYAMVFKDERESGKKLRVAFADKPTGPFRDVSEPFTPQYHSEGPTVARVGEDWVVYYDLYNDGKYAAMKTRDFKTWEDASTQLAMPAGTRHGSVLRVPRAVVMALLKR